VLDLSFNNIMSLRRLRRAGWLTHLNLSHNPSLMVQGKDTEGFADLSQILESLSLRKTGLVHIDENTFRNMQKLRHLDIRDNELKIVDRNMFLGLNNLQVLEADDS
ncbi:hypothetical protein BaRGS_00013268, partial [Batillaria attramentaria]